VSCRLGEEIDMRLDESAVVAAPVRTRHAYFSRGGWSMVNVHRLESLNTNMSVAGPAIVESAFTTIVIDPGAVAVRRPSGSLSIDVAQ
jgi:N-methylhydantoinase A